MKPSRCGGFTWLVSTDLAFHTKTPPFPSFPPGDPGTQSTTESSCFISKTSRLRRLWRQETRVRTATTQSSALLVPCSSVQKYLARSYSLLDTAVGIGLPALLALSSEIREVRERYVCVRVYVCMYVHTIQVGSTTAKVRGSVPVVGLA
ncbi:hypothetical protein L209DRAFT_756096 [Thermothelomyces heterothallicus CBS 203.75]